MVQLELLPYAVAEASRTFPAVPSFSLLSLANPVHWLHNAITSSVSETAVISNRFHHILLEKENRAEMATIAITFLTANDTQNG